MKTNLFASKLTARIDYLSRAELNKRFDCRGLPSVTRLISVSNKKQKAWFETQMRDKTSPMYKATVQGRKVHSALETGNVDDGLTHATLACFTDKILIDLDEVWGQEQWLYHPDRYIGKFDGCGVYRGKVTLFDYKKTNKPKTRKQMENYFIQLVAYKRAHEFLYDVQIEQVAVFNLFGVCEKTVDANVEILPSEFAQETEKTFLNALIKAG